MTTIISPLQRSIDAIAVAGIRILARPIAEGDEAALLPDERGVFMGRAIQVWRASGAARIAARQLLLQAGREPCAIPRSATGAPIWPDGVVGSLAHDASVAIAAIAMQRDVLSVGIDVEPAEALEPDLTELIATPQERAGLGDDPRQTRLLFSIKEAVYKAVYPLDRTFLDHHDVEVDWSAGLARVRGGRVVEVRWCLSTHIVSLAFIRPSGAGRP